MGEKLLAKLLEGKRERTILATKYKNTFDTGDPNFGGNHRRA